MNTYLTLKCKAPRPAYCVQPNNLLRWHNADFILPYPKDNPPRLKVFKEPLCSEDIDRSYGNSPYYFYAYDEAKS